jgi:hypothetical protein
MKKPFPVVSSVKEGTATGDQEQLQSVRRIRRIARLKPIAGFWSVLENLGWGLSPGSSILFLALTILCVRMYLNLGHDYLSTLVAHLGERCPWHGLGWNKEVRHWLLGENPGEGEGLRLAAVQSTIS